MCFKLHLWALLAGAFLFSSHLCSQTWKSQEWLRLGRYHENLLGGYSSEADGPSFFLHPEGATRPDLELAALIEGIQQPPLEDVNQHASCRFPARTAFILRERPELSATPVHCEKFEQFKERLSAQSVSLVFSSYYLNNPASSFGHTFIRLGKKPHSPTSGEPSLELLDTGINYGASTGDANALTYVVGAFVGYFYGSYNSIPYYYKVREYNDFESRDLWTYHLDFNSQEIEQLVRHIWELGHGEFRYYFLTENCSYHALTMLEAVRPGLELVKYLPDRYIIPTDTLKVVVEQKIVKDITYRPSASTHFYHYLKHLNSEDEKWMRDILQGKPIPSDLPFSKQAFLFDASLSLVDYKYAKAILKEEESALKLKRPLLVARSQVPIKSPDLDFSQTAKIRPHEGHHSGRLALGGSSLEGDKLLHLSYRFAFHDFLDYQKSYLPNSRVEMFSAKSVTNGEGLSFTDLNIVDYYSLGAFDEYTKSFSWKLKFGQWNTYPKGVQGFTTHGMNAGYGYSYVTDYLTPFALASIETSYISEGYHKFKLAYGLDMGVILNFNDHFRFHSIYEQRFYPWEENFSKNEIRWSNVNYSVGAFYHAQTKLGFNEVGLNLMVYTR